MIERASLDDIRDLPTDRIASELPELISDMVRAAASNGAAPFQLDREQADRAASLAELRGGRNASAGDVARDVASLQAVLVHALREEIGDSDPERFADAVERLAEAAGEIQAAAIEELVRNRSRELESQANTDALTSLYNLRFVQREIAQLLETHKRYGHPFAVLIMDIDGLKRINDSHGHQAGDRVLMQVAMAIQRAIRSVDVAARLGGDEFCVLAPNQDSGSAVTLAQRLSAAVEEEVATPEAPPASLSVGVVSCPEHGDVAEVLIDLADRAMYRAKADGSRVALGDTGGSQVAEEAKT